MLVCWLVCVLTTHQVDLGPRMVTFGTYELQHAGVSHVLGSGRVEVTIRDPIFDGGFE